MTLGRSDSRLTGKHYQPAWACDIPRTIYSISGVDFQDSAKSDLCMCPKIRGTVPKKTYVKIRFFPMTFMTNGHTLLVTPIRSRPWHLFGSQFSRPKQRRLASGTSGTWTIGIPSGNQTRQLKI